MKPATERSRQWLRFEMIIQCRTVTPDLIPPEFDQSGSKHNSEDEPAKKNNNGKRRSAFWEGPHFPKGAKKYCKETGFQELNFPSISIPLLSDVHKRHIQKPKHKKDGDIRITGNHDQRKNKSNPGKNK